MVKNKIAIIGAGKLAHSITQALFKAGYNVHIIVSRKLRSAKSLANKFSIPNYSNSLKTISSEVVVFFLTVPDGEIKKVAVNLSKLKRNFKNSTCIHFSGVENIGSLSSLANKGCATGALHIMQTFPSKNLVRIKDSPATIESVDKTALIFLNRLCKKLGLKSFRISSEEKVLYHLAGVYSSNFLVGNLFNAFSLFNSKDKNPADIYKTTSYTTLKNVFGSSPANALSGPVDRGDIYTIKKHLEMFDKKISEVKSKDKFRYLRMNYIIQSLSLLDVVKAKYGKLSKKHLKIKKFLTSKLG